MDDKKMKIIANKIDAVELAAELPADQSWDLIVFYNLLAIKAEVSYMGAAPAIRLSNSPLNVFAFGYTDNLLHAIGLVRDNFGDIVELKREEGKDEEE